MAVGIVEEREAAMAAAEREAAMAAVVVRAMAAAARVEAARVAAAKAAVAERVAAVPGMLRLCHRRRWGLLARSRLCHPGQRHRHTANKRAKRESPMEAMGTFHRGDGNF